MLYPTFFEDAPRLRMRDPLSAFLGATRDGIIEYGYLDAVKLTGHSCPTVAGAYRATVDALAALYGDNVPVRGDVAVRLDQPSGEGVAGVVAAVCGLLTGAAGDGGFPGIGGRFDRRDLLRFGDGATGRIVFRRRDTGAAVVAEADLAAVPPHPALRHLMQKVLAGTAVGEEQEAFRRHWQDRVARILLGGPAEGAVKVLAWEEAAPEI